MGPLDNLSLLCLQMKISTPCQMDNLFFQSAMPIPTADFSITVRQISVTGVVIGDDFCDECQTGSARLVRNSSRAMVVIDALNVGLSAGCLAPFVALLRQLGFRPLHSLPHQLML
jgi:hypothetical protein